MKLIDQIKAARRVSTPIVAIETQDPAATQQLIVEKMNGKGTAYVSWDIVEGFQGLNSSGDEQCPDKRYENNLPKALSEAKNFKAKTVLFVHNAHRYLDMPPVMQAVWNLRDAFKADGRMLILMGPSIKLPEELKSDIVCFDEPLPNDEELTKIVWDVIADAGDNLEFEPKPEDVQRAARALKGTSAFGAEQLAAMSLRPKCIEHENLDSQARHMIEQTPGLTFERGKETFNDIGGLGFIKEFGRRMFSGPRAPAVIVRVEELEKTMSGAKGDLSGTSGDALQVLLSDMEDNGWSGILAYGIPGASKSLFSKSLANTFGAKAVRLDVNATKNSLVGSSEQRIRQAMKVIKTIGGDRVFFVASINRLDSLPPELQRRFRAGCWYFDVPNEEERQEIWSLHTKNFGVDGEAPDEPEMTGADIRDICEMASMLQCSLREALDYVVPFKVRSPDAIEECRNIASGRFVDASRGGVYRKDRRPTTKKSRRKISV